MEEKLPGCGYGIVIIAVLMIMLGGFCTSQAIFHVVSRAGSIWLSLLFVNFVLIALEDFRFLKTHYGRIPVRRIRLSLAMILAVAPAGLMLPIGKDWQPYTFEAERAAILAGNDVPDDQNAATLYQSLFDKLGPDPELPEFVKAEQDALLTGPWTEDGYPEIAIWLRTQADTIETLIQILDIEQCHFPIRPYMWDEADNSVHTRYLIRLLIISANFDMKEHSPHAAITKYIAAFKMSNQYLGQPDLMDFLVGLGIEMVTLKPVRTFIMANDSSSEDVRVLTQEIATENTWSDYWPKLLDVEVLKIKNHMGRFYEVNPQGNTRLTHRWSNVFDPHNRPSGDERLKNIFAPVFLAYLMPWRPATAARTVDMMFEPLAREDFNWDELGTFQEHCLRTARPLLARDFFMSFEPLIAAYAKVNDLLKRVLAMQRGVHVLVGLKAYHDSRGQWPDSLADIGFIVPPEAFIDPTNGGAFVYMLTTDGFKLYSTGKNAVDEGGKRDRGTGEDDILIWPLDHDGGETEASEESPPAGTDDDGGRAAGLANKTRAGRVSLDKPPFLWQNLARSFFRKAFGVFASQSRGAAGEAFARRSGRTDDERDDHGAA
ncbi:MAG: hypothetical protein IH624_02855 [Phycisphaerae bacterium]|nr:hypothetical protein [Phycisphaerae bacterium]